jgi:hypothetical protein
MPNKIIFMFRKFKSLLFFSGLFLLLGACASTLGYSSKNYEKVLDTWVGEKIDTLVESWGYPQKKFIAPNGRKVYVYERSRIVKMLSEKRGSHSDRARNSFTNAVAILASSGQKISSDKLLFICMTWIETNDDGDIVNWRWNGNDCTAGELK